MNDNGVMSGSETEVLRMATKSESVRDECRFVTDEKWALRSKRGLRGVISSMFRVNESAASACPIKIRTIV